jgi:hypothetical protein
MFCWVELDGSLTWMKKGCSIVRYFGVVGRENRSQLQSSVFLKAGTVTEQKLKPQNRHLGSVRFGSVRFPVFGEKMPFPK